MLTPEGCRSRRERLWLRIRDRNDMASLVLADPIHLRYLANCYVDPISLGGDFGPILQLRRDGHATLYYEKRLPPSVERSHTDERIVVPWYDGQSPGVCSRPLALKPALERMGGRVHDHISDPLCEVLIDELQAMRRCKDPDEIELLRTCMRITEAGHAWSRRNVRAGMTELDVYSGIASACNQAAERAVVVYGDFAVSPGPSRRGGPATSRVLRDGDTLIVDFSVIIDGYRSDFTNTIVVGGHPSKAQQNLFDACVSAMTAGEKMIRAGVACQSVFDAIYSSFAKEGLSEHFPHHAGHGLGICHPEPPYIVRNSTEMLEVGDVITVEPGLYVSEVGGFRIEHNYLVLSNGFERLSRHEIAI